MTQLGSNIGWLMTHFGLTLKQLSQLSGVPLIALQKQKDGVTQKPQPHNLAKLAGVFGITPDELLHSKHVELAKRVKDLPRQEIYTRFEKIEASLEAYRELVKQQVNIGHQLVSVSYDIEQQVAALRERVRELKYTE